MKHALAMTVTIVGLSADLVAGCSSPSAPPPGDDAAGQDATVPGDGGAVFDAGGGLLDAAVVDATMSDASAVDSSSGDAGSGGDACAPSGAGALGVLGCPCSSPGQLACNGNAQKVTLICNAGTWTYSQTCPVGDNCNSGSGLNQGLCLAIDPLCASAVPGQNVCSNATTVVQCGPDLVSDLPVETCTNQTCVSGACAGVCGPTQVNCNGQQPQTCSSTGTWDNSGAACVDEACLNGACTGVCVPNALRCIGEQPQACSSAGVWEDGGAPCSQPTPDCNQGSCTCLESLCPALDGGTACVSELVSPARRRGLDRPVRVTQSLGRGRESAISSATAAVPRAAGRLPARGPARAPARGCDAG